MNETIIVLILIFLSFIMGIVPVLLIGCGLFWKYIQAFISGRTIVVVHLKRGGTTFRLALPYAGAPVLNYTLRGSKDIHSVSTPEGSVIRGGLVSWIHTPEGSTAPFIFDNVVQQVVKKKVFVLDEKGVKVLDENKKPMIEEVSEVEWIKFIGYDDSSIIKQLFDWALLRPKVLIGNFKLSWIIIGLVVIVGIIIMVSTMSGAGGVSNVI